VSEHCSLSFAPTTASPQLYWRHNVRLIQGILAATLAVGLAAPVQAQSAADYPNRPITFIVPFSAGVSASQREKAWPDVPALKEVGYSFDFDSPTGLAGPKGMDPAIVQKLHDAFKKAYDDPSMLAHYDKVQFSRRYMNSADYTALAAKLVADERDALSKVGLLKKD
jgi:tripartite-type tricarboxylate transporter receptor subunit TctC